MFKVGDKVRIPGSDEDHGVVVYGPYLGATGTWCLVEKPDGHHFAAAVEILRAAPKFKVGEVVRSSGLLQKVIAGPFTRETGSKWYVLEAPDGSQDMEYEDYMVPVVE